MTNPRPGQKLPLQGAVSAGGVVYRRGPRGIEVVLCGRTEDGVWGLPKGTPSPGESLEQAAVREVTEETGLQVAIERKAHFHPIGAGFLIGGGLVTADAMLT